MRTVDQGGPALVIGHRNAPAFHSFGGLLADFQPAARHELFEFAAEALDVVVGQCAPGVVEMLGCNYDGSECGDFTSFVTVGVVSVSRRSQGGYLCWRSPVLDEWHQSAVEDYGGT